MRGQPRRTHQYLAAHQPILPLARGGFLAVFHQPSIRSRALPLAEAAPLDTINI